MQSVLYIGKGLFELLLFLENNYQIWLRDGTEFFQEVAGKICKISAHAD